MLKINVLGPLQISRCDKPIQNNLGLKEQCLLTYLLVENKSLYDRDTLSQMLWEDTGRENSLGSLRLAIWNLRNFFKVYEMEDIIQSQGNRYIRFQFEDILCDIFVWRKTISSKKDHTISSLEIISALYRDDFLKNLYLKNNISFNDWVLAQRDLLQREFEDTQLKLAELYVKAGRFEHAIKEINRIIAIDPYNEKFYYLKMKYQYQTSNKVAAIYTYNKLKRILMNDLNVSPDRYINELYTKIISGESIDSLPKQNQSNIRVNNRSMNFYLCKNNTLNKCYLIFSNLDNNANYIIDLCKSPGKRVDYEGLFELMDVLKIIFLNKNISHYDKYLSVYSSLQEKDFLDYVLFSNILSLLDQFINERIIFRIWDINALDAKSMDFMRFAFLNSSINSFDYYILIKDPVNNEDVKSFLSLLVQNPNVTVTTL